MTQEDFMHNFIFSFSGKPIDRKQIATGMYLCYMNARDLLDEAKLLKENGHYARALSLAILVLEELGKIPILCNMILCRPDDSKTWNQLWKELQSHRVKLEIITVYGKQLLKKLGKGFKSELPAGIEPLIDKLKQLGFYVNFHEDQFVLPQDFAKDNYQWLDWLLMIADERILSFQRFHESLEKSEKFTDKGIEFFAAYTKARRKAKNRDELNKALMDLISKQKPAEFD